MRNKLNWSICFVLGFVGIASAVTNVIYSDYADGVLENRSEWSAGPVVHNDWEWEGNVGEWYGSGLTTIVLPFQLPDYGPLTDPFVSADLGIMVHTIGGDTVTAIDLYGVRIDASPLISSNDWYNGSAPDSTATLIQESFLTSSSAAGFVGAPNNFTDTTGSSNLLSYLNTAYNGGAGAGEFVFLRLSYGSDSFASGWDAYKMTMRNAGQEGEWPRVILTVDESADSDSDGLPDIWEGAYGLDPYDDGSVNTNNGALGNPDTDGLVNSNEYTLGTDPQNSDTDGDDLSDGDEVNVTLTDPLLYDTDSDGLSDGDEVNNTGTNPNEADTDGDTENDWFELFQGTDPKTNTSSSAILGLAIIDGSLDTNYGAAVSTQTVNTVWEDNLDELNAAYAYIQNDRLFLMLTGNMNTNWNSVEVFIDSTDAVTTNVFDAQGGDNTGNMNGLVFDSGFSPDYHLNFRLGVWNGAYNFNMDFMDLATKAGSYHLNLFEGLDGGTGYMGPGDASSNIIAVAFTNSNVAGIVAGTTAANQSDALAVTTGLEFSIALADLGNPYGEIRVMAMVTTSSHAETSNQLLSGSEPGLGALGATSNVNFNAISGNQFFGFVGQLVPAPAIMSMQMLTGSTEVELGMDGLIAGETYKVQDSGDLVHSAFSDMAGSDFVATNSAMTVAVPADTGASPVLFYRVIAP